MNKGISIKSIRKISLKPGEILVIKVPKFYAGQPGIFNRITSTVKKISENRFAFMVVDERFDFVSVRTPKQEPKPKK